MVKTMEVIYSDGPLERQPPDQEEMCYNEARNEWHTVTEWPSLRFILACKKKFHDQLALVTCDRSSSVCEEWNRDQLSGHDFSPGWLFVCVSC